MNLTSETYKNLMNIINILQTIPASIFISPFSVDRGYLWLAFSNEARLMTPLTKLSKLRFSDDCLSYLLQYNIKESDLLDIGLRLGEIIPLLNQKEKLFLENFFLSRDIEGRIYASEVQDIDYHNLVGSQTEQEAKDYPWILLKDL